MEKYPELISVKQRHLLNTPFAGHEVHREKPSVANEIIIEFIQRITTKDSSIKK